MLDRLRGLAAPAVAYTLIVATLFSASSTHSAVTVMGGSMNPALRHGDVAVVARYAKPNRGDIVLFRSGHSQVLHRVERVMPGGRVVTRGDANPVHDFAPALPDDVKGVVVAVLPAGTLLERWR